MRKLLTGCVLLIISAFAFALPSPHQIEDALAARDYVSARTMVQEVLSERPDSARAHLMNAYLLEHVDHNLGAARAELQTASGLDRRGDVKGSALFGRVVAEMDAQPVQRAVQATRSAAVPHTYAPERSSFPTGAFLIFVALGIAFIVFAVLVIRAQRPSTVVIESRRGGYGRSRASTPSPVSPSSGGSGVYVHPTQIYEPAPTLVYPASARGGMTAGENFASTAGGVVAGNVLSDALLRGSRNRMDDSDDEYERRRRRNESPADSTYAPSPSPAVDYASERSSFSSSSSGSDSWGSSSSSDYSSSSSSDSWGSSSDSGGGSSDW